ncbi:penicillin-binding protein [Nocardioides panacisoli]|uniref:penicillin-binding protein n=1 Tax=Nocardioides panacisoli TaxID=627624 RepID=UPI001C63A9A8|nr:penicillin-binding protein [Nocardioides panacisoli]QYJ03692.1 penicillin-binding protein [Nocardioides panacisoli]
MARSDADKLPAGKIASHLGVMALVSAVLGVVVSGLAIPFAGVAGLSARSIAGTAEDLPQELETDLLAQRTILEDRAGNTIATIYDQNRIVIPLKQISKQMVKALLAVEDYRFYQHGALDLKGTLRALVTNQAADEVVQGGSSITQQLVKQTLVNQADGDEEAIARATDESYARKIRELRYAIALEKKYSKDWILERYLNTVYFGDGAYGVQSAAKHFFNVDAKDLNRKQAATLAGLVQSPEALNPTSYPERAKERRDVVLRRMASLGAAPEKRVEQLQGKGLGLDVQAMPNGCDDSVATWYCEYAIEYLLNDRALGETKEDRRRLIRTGGLRIQTAIDTRMQRSAQQAVANNVNSSDTALGAMALVEPGTGEVKALAQSRPQGDGPGQTYLNYTVPKQFGNANGFQPGSTFKVFVLAAAINQGIPLNRRISAAEPATVQLNSFKTCEGNYRSSETWSPGNSTNSSATPDLYEGTQNSVNTFFVRLEQEVGICQPWRLARQMGIRTLDKGDQIPSFTLGVADVSPLDMAGAYATFAARGINCNPRPVLKISDANGNQLKSYDKSCKRVFDEEVGDAVNDVLRGVIEPGGFGAPLTPGQPAAGKTGTTSDNKAVWFSGYTPNMAGAAVVAGVNNDTGRQITLDGQTIGGVFRTTTAGSTTAGPIWGETFQGISGILDDEDFVQPTDKIINGEQGTVPNVSGDSIASARGQLEDAGYNPVVGDERNSNVSEGLVAYSSPGGGATYGKGLTVYIYPSTGFVPPPPKKKNNNGGNNGGGNGGGRGNGGNNGGGNGGGGRGNN